MATITRRMVLLMRWSLNKVSLYGCLYYFDAFITGASYIKIMLMENNNLQCLDIGHNFIGDDGMKLISEGLLCNNTLTKLYAEKCGFSVEGR